MSISVEIKLLNSQFYQDFPLPAYATSGSAGLDLRAAVNSEFCVPAGETHLIPTGLAIYLADPHYAALILPRSGLGHKHGLVLGNLVGLIDSDYQGELMISCWNRSQVDYKIMRGDRIAQLIVVPIAQVSFQEVDTFNTSDRSHGGFGSTGRK